MSAIDTANPTFSFIAPGTEPASLGFELLLRISPAVSRAMRSPVPLAQLTDFVKKIGFNTDHKPLKYVGDLSTPTADLKGKRTHEIIDLIESQLVCAFIFNPSVSAAFYAPRRWSGYYVFHTVDKDALIVHRLHICKVA